jgi:hypothetical protein
MATPPDEPTAKRMRLGGNFFSPANGLSEDQIALFMSQSAASLMPTRAAAVAYSALSGNPLPGVCLFYGSSLMKLDSKKMVLWGR